MCADEHRRQTKVLLRLVMFHRRLGLMNVAHWEIKKTKKPSFWPVYLQNISQFFQSSVVLLSVLFSYLLSNDLVYNLVKPCLMFLRLYRQRRQAAVLGPRPPAP